MEVAKVAGADPGVRPFDRSKKAIGIQVGTVSFRDEGVEQVLDIFQQRAHINTLFLAVFSYDRGIAGRQIPGFPLPDHGKQEYDTAYFHGGNFATPHSHFYKDTPLKQTKAPDFGNYDVLEAVLPAAKKRNMRVICWEVTNFLHQGVAGVGHFGRRACGIWPSALQNTSPSERTLDCRSARTCSMRSITPTFLA